ncbi:MAG: sortase [Bacilli bacterium]|nr:sortase [Bacilli bacterium]
MQKTRKINRIYFIGIFIFLCGAISFTSYYFIKFHNRKEIEVKVEEYIDNSSKVTVEESETQEEKESVGVNYNIYDMVIEIPSINLKHGLYDINSRYNSVNYGLQILRESDMPNVTNGNLVIAGHSGTSSISYFRYLYRLKNDDLVFIYYKGTKYIYKINNIYEEEKDGSITIHRDNNRTIIALITCKSRSNNQYVFIGELINKEVY